MFSDILEKKTTISFIITTKSCSKYIVDSAT